MRLSILSLFLIFFLAGCSKQKTELPKDRDRKSYHAKKPSMQIKGSVSSGQNDNTPTDSKSVQEIKFNYDRYFGSTDEIIIGQIASFAIDNSNRVFIADQSQTTIHVFNPDGSYHTSLGKQGKGPGEFAAVSSRTTMTIHSKRLYVTDVTEGHEFFPTRVQIFSMEDLSFSHTMKLLPGNKHEYHELEKYFPKQFYPLNGGMFLVAYHRSPFEYRDSVSMIRYMIQDSTGNIIGGPILEQKDLKYLVYTYASGGSRMHSFPFFEKSLLTVSSNEKLYAAATREFNISIFDTNGEYINSFRHSFKNKALNLSKLIDSYKKSEYMAQLDRRKGEGIALKMLREAQNLPTTWPALETMFFDDRDRLWVATIVEDMEVYEWWILEKTGDVITKFEWPRDKSIEEVKNGYMYTRETNEMDVGSIIKYNIEME